MRPLIGITADYSNGIYNLRRHYIDALKAASCDAGIAFISDDVNELITRYDGIVLSGGDDIHPSYYGEGLLYELTLIDNARTDLEIALVRGCLEADRPVLGICNGMQLMNVALGGNLFQDIDSQLSVEINHKKGYHTISVTGTSLLREGTYSVNSAHHQAIKEMGEGISAIAKSDDGIIEAITVQGCSFALGVQWHPERDQDSEINMALFSRFREACIAGK